MAGFLGPAVTVSAVVAVAVGKTIGVSMDATVGMAVGPAGLVGAAGLHPASTSTRAKTTVSTILLILFSLGRNWFF
jgi:hypothetical protein